MDLDRRDFIRQTAIAELARSNTIVIADGLGRNSAAGAKRRNMRIPPARLSCFAACSTLPRKTKADVAREENS